MPIPTYQQFMGPLLQFISDGKEHDFSEIVDGLANQLKITPDERKILKANGSYPLLNDRIAWAKTYLKKAMLINYPKRATVQITDRGQNTLNEYGDSINDEVLKNFSEFRDFIKPKNSNITDTELVEVSQQTPDETMSTAYETINKGLADEILSRVLSKPPSFFESLVARLLVAMGYGGSESDILQSAGGKGDGGIDGIIKQDKLGLDIVYVQAKRFKKETSITPHDVRDFIGALSYKGAKKGVFITTSNFSKEAQKVPENDTKVILIDGEKLAEYMIEFNVGVSIKNTFLIKEIDNDFFDDDY